MKIALAPDKFKGSLTGLQFCNAVSAGIKKVYPKVKIIKLPLADGGDGTLEILEYHLGGEHITVKVNDPLFRKIEATYLYIESLQTAFIEMAQASGMLLLKQDEQNCFNTTTLGTGELIIDAINKGAKSIILGIGGSATNDCGIGMATALGYKFEDKYGNELPPIGKSLLKIRRINSDNVIGSLKSIIFKIACDVSNPLYGPTGAALVYGHQKGASKEEIVELDKGLKHISNIIKKQFNIEVQDIKGAGAAGGIGAGSVVFLNGELCSGIEMIKDLINFENKLNNTDWIITGEGKLDYQTLSGKTINGILSSASAKKIPVAALCGNVSLDKSEIDKMGVDYTDAVMNYANSLEDALLNSSVYLTKMASVFAKQL